jgi:hypothetical protein
VNASFVWVTAGRLTNKQRKRTLTEEIMADPQLEAVSEGTAR